MMPQSCLVPAVLEGFAQSRLWRVAVLIGLTLNLGCVTRSQAATSWTVCASSCDYPSIKSAIAAPTTVDGDTVAIAAGTYTEAGIIVDKSLTLQGEKAATTIVQAAATRWTASDRVFTIPSGVTVTLQDLTIRYGYARDASGGGIENRGTLTLLNTAVRDNAAENSGGGLANIVDAPTEEGTLTLTNSTIRGNVTHMFNGGGLYNHYGRVILISSTMSGNTAGFSGGGGRNFGGTLTLLNSTIRGNAAKYDGGGLDNWGPLTLTASTVSGNTAGFSGGGLINMNGSLTLTNSTISGNTADDRGGGLANFAYSDTLTLLNSTVSGNTASNGGGLYNAYTLTLTNSLVAYNSHGGDCRNFASNFTSTTSTGYNLDSDGSCQLTAPTDLPDSNPLLGPLQDNGGPTLTHALLPGSPAIDAIPWGTNGCGTTLYSDQRWQARPQPAGGPCDIGAYEVAVPGQAFGGWVSGFTPRTVVCQNVTTGQAVTLSAPASPWDCEAAGLGVTPGDRVALRVRGPVKQSATDVGGTVVGMTPSSGSCTNLTTGQQVTFRQMKGATAASCTATGLVVHPGDTVQMRVQGAAE